MLSRCRYPCCLAGRCKARAESEAKVSAVVSCLGQHTGRYDKAWHAVFEPVVEVNT